MRKIERGGFVNKTYCKNRVEMSVSNVIMTNKDSYTRQKEAYSGTYVDTCNNVYDLCEYCGYWSLYMRVGDNGHTKTIIANSNLSDCLYEITTRGLTKLH